MPVKKYATVPILFYRSDNTIIKRSWNTMKNNIDNKQRNNIKIDSSEFYNQYFHTKESASKIIIEKRKSMNRPLMQKDFENIISDKDTVSYQIIARIWGNFNNMIKDLGLDSISTWYFDRINNEFIDYNEILNRINMACNNIKLENRNIITSSQLQEYTHVPQETLHDYMKRENTTLDQVLFENGCCLQNAGTGFNYKYNDGEKVMSSLEFDFSNFLRDKLKLIFNKDYFRNVQYKTISETYNGNIDCDYKIVINNKIIYVEIAGFLSNKTYWSCFVNDIPIKSKSKENYRQKLKLKKQLLEETGNEYYIFSIFDIQEKIYKEIFSEIQLKES